MAQRQIFFDAQSLYNLLVHYTEGQEAPLNGELLEVGVSNYLGRWVGMRVRSNEWKGRLQADGGLAPIHIRYECKRLMKWRGDNHEEGPQWSPSNSIEAPRRQ